MTGFASLRSRQQSQIKLIGFQLNVGLFNPITSARHIALLILLPVTLSWFTDSMCNTAGNSVGRFGDLCGVRGGHVC